MQGQNETIIFGFVAGVGMWVYVIYIIKKNQCLICVLLDLKRETS